MADPFTDLHETLRAHADRLRDAPIRALFDADPARMEALAVSAAGLTLDVSKQALDREALEVLIGAGHARFWPEKSAAMLSGEIVNPTEGRSALHTALRDPSRVADAHVRAFVADAEARMDRFATEVRGATRTGATGRPISAVVHLGIGGSDLGPKLLHDAARHARDRRFTLRFAANVDPADINDALFGLDPETTLVVIVSKSFSTQETLLNANVAREWLRTTLGKEGANQHLIAVTANASRAQEYGVDPAAIFEFRDWVGGRFSLWSAVSLSLAIALGPEWLGDLREGAAAMDAHFADEPPHRNMVWLKALTDIWNRSYLQFPTRAVVPYAKALALLPNYLQQLEMESNGKGVTLDGCEVALPTAAVVWGAEGSNAQHAFFQHLHQSPDRTPVDLIGLLADEENNPYSTRVLQANLLAQAEALMLGDARPDDPHRHFTGNRPSTILFLDDLSARSVGALIALFEHKVYLEAVWWGINAFDQFGVELGKKLAQGTLASLEGKGGDHDPSTAFHLARLRQS